MNISAINLNLVVVLDALLAERNVSRAGRRLGLSQPAVSNALAQLRLLLRDPLFVRAPAGVVPTERALALAGPVRAALATLEGALAPEAAFDPATAERTFVVAATDFMEFVLLPRLLARLAAEAPGIRLQLRSWPFHRVPEALATGEVDLALGFHAALPPRHRAETLFEDQFVVIVRKGHPRVGRRLSLDTYASLSHILVTQEASSQGVVDLALARLGRQRTVGLRTSHFLMVPPIVAATDMVAALSVFVAEWHARVLPLAIFRPPVALERGNTDIAKLLERF